MEKKGQAAMEFLMTYGWAILAAVIAIGVLAYFGVFSPGKYTTGATIVNPPFYADGGVATASSGVSLELRNNGGEDLDIQSVAVSNCETSSTVVTIAAGENEVLVVTCDPVLTEGDNFKGDITITYKKAGSSLDLTSTGTISSKVTA